MPVPYDKKFLDVPEQLALLRSRGMDIGDDARAAAALERIGYYRLSGYCYPFRKMLLRLGQTPPYEILDDFKPGSELRHVLDLYVFDKRLRLLFLDAIERIEVALRVDIALMLGARDPWAHRDPATFHPGAFTTKPDPVTGQTPHTQWLAKGDTGAERSSDEFAKHHLHTYTSPLPIWKAIELWDFGALSTILGALTVTDLKTLCAKYGIPRWQLLPSWVRAINHIRNICAHHGRLWNRSPADQPKPPRVGEIPLLDHVAEDTLAQSRIYATAAIMRYLLWKINPMTTWGNRLQHHFATFPATPHVAVTQTGFPSGWAQLPLWLGPPGRGTCAAEREAGSAPGSATEPSEGKKGSL